jgi:arylsulfatase A-like enzyme
LFTGLYPSQHGAHKPFPWDAKGGYHVYPLDTKHTTLAELLSQEGYQTCGISANPIVNRYYGLDQGFEYYSARKDVIYAFGFVRFLWHLNRVERVNFLPWADTIVPHAPPPYRRAEDINREVIGWLEEHGDTPFFLFVNYLDAHKPYLPKPPYHLRWPGLNKEWIRYDTLPVAATRDIYSRKRSITPSERNHLVALYDGELSYLDDQLGILFDYMRGRGLLDNTLVVVTSDHGESLGDHYNLEHEFNLYQELIHVPLVVRYPSSVQIEGGGIVSSPVQTVDIVSTILALLDIPSAKEAQGKTLFQRRDYQFAEKFMDFLYGLKAFERVSRCVVQMPYKYIWHSDGTEELYRLDRDPLETTSSCPRPSRRRGNARKFESFRIHSRELDSGRTTTSLSGCGSTDPKGLKVAQ